MSTDLERVTALIADRYRIERELGRGGMATVYLARDLRHDRLVAVKVLSPDLAVALGPERFLREIRLTAQLEHPSIVPLLDSGNADGVLYYVMPHVDGESLRSRLNRETQLPVSDALQIAREVGDALGYAHSQGIVHRDIKPENILLSAKHARVADFGVALAVTVAGGETLTETGLVIGTLTYMSPEQAAGGEHVDGRSDLYSLGCVTYEMLTGEPPFTASNSQALLARKTMESARPVRSVRPSVPVHIEQAVLTALAPVAADRYATVAEFVSRLGGTALRPRADKTMLLVLPLDNFGRDPDQEYFSDGLTEELITQLAKLSPRHLAVIARTTAMQYKNTGKSIAEIGAELGVDYVIEGSARRAGDRVRVTVQLIKVEDQTHVWAESYDRKISDVFQVQEDVAYKVAGAMRVKLLSENSVIVARLEQPRDPLAYDAYLKGLHYARSFFVSKSPADHARATEFLAQATMIDAAFAAPRAALARLAFEHYRDYGDEDSLRRSGELARQLLHSDPNSASARGTIASVLLWSGQKELAIREARIALEVNPDEAAAREALGVGYNMCGMLLKGTEQFAAWRRIDPLAPAPFRRIVDAYIWTGDFDRARTLLLEALDLFPGSPVFRRHIARVHYQRGELEAAEALLNETLALEPFRGFEARAQLALVCARTGRVDRGDELLSKEVCEYARRDFLESILYPAQFYALTDRPSRALEWLHTAISAGNENYPWFAVNPDFEPLRPMPEFQRLMAEVKQSSDYYCSEYGR